MTGESIPPVRGGGDDLRVLRDAVAAIPTEYQGAVGSIFIPTKGLTEQEINAKVVEELIKAVAQAHAAEIGEIRRLLLQRGPRIRAYGQAAVLVGAERIFWPFMGTIGIPGIVWGADTLDLLLPIFDLPLLPAPARAAIILLLSGLAVGGAAWTAAKATRVGREELRAVHRLQKVLADGSLMKKIAKKVSGGIEVSLGFLEELGGGKGRERRSALGTAVLYALLGSALGTVAVGVGRVAVVDDARKELRAALDEHALAREDHRKPEGESPAQIILREGAEAVWVELFGRALVLARSGASMVTRTEGESGKQE